MAPACTGLSASWLSRRPGFEMLPGFLMSLFGASWLLDSCGFLASLVYCSVVS